MKKVFFVIGLIGLVFLGKHLYFKAHVLAGDKAENFIFTTLNNEKRQLQDYKGQYVYLQFWGSWCGPCRAHNRQFASLLREYQSKGLVFIGIGLETDRSQWENAMQADGIQWENNHFSAERLKGPIATLYGIKQVPTSYLIGPKGQVLLYNPTFATLESKLLQVLP